MASPGRRAIPLALLLLAAAAGPAGAAGIATNIDLNYSYEQLRAGEDVEAKTAFTQKFEVKYETSLSSSFDFLGAVRLELDDTWNTDGAGTTKVAPTLELEVKGTQASLKTSYAGVMSTTDARNEDAESTTFSNNFDAELQLVPAPWPETRLKFQQRRDYEEQKDERTSRSAELQMKKDIYELRLEFSLKSERVDRVMPVEGGTESIDWSGKATYKDVLYGETEFELSYEIRESYSEDEIRGVFTGDDEEYTQELKTRLRKPIEITPRLKVNLSWEYGYQQDLLKLDTDHEINNKYLADFRYDMLNWVKVAGEAKRETSLTVNLRGEDDEGDITDSARITADLDPVAWLRFGGKAEVKHKQALAAETGGSVDDTVEEKYEGVVKNRFGELWDLTVNASGSQTHEQGLLVKRDGRFKSELKLKLYDLVVTPSYEAARTADWVARSEDPSKRGRTRDAKIRFEYKRQLLDLLQATFSHEYGMKWDDALDEVLDFERTVTLNEGTRLSLLLAEIVRDLKIEGEIDRKGSDTRDDGDPMLVDLAYSLKLEYKLADLTVSASLKYNDKGDAFDDLAFNTKLGWKGERIDISGEYQFDKIYADEPEEKRKLNLKLNYKF